MILFLTSSPCVPNADRAILNPANGFVDRLRAVLPTAPKCLFICSDPDSPDLTDRFGQEMAEAFAEAGMELKEFPALDRRNDEDAQSLIWESDLVILAGGHVPTQNAYFQEIGLAELLENYQGVLMGISAGTMNCAWQVYMQPEAAGESGPEFERYATGLGLTDVNVLPHYQQVKDYLLDGKRLYEDITFADSIGERFFVFVDGTYLLIEDGQTTLYGEAYCLQDGQMEQLSKLGDVVIIEE
jgi:dipeptidase E